MVSAEAGASNRCLDNAKLGGMERSYAEDNARELERLRALVSKLSDQDLGSMVNEYWTVAGVLGHMAFWPRAVPRWKDAARRGPHGIRYRAGERGLDQRFHPPPHPRHPPATGG